MTASETLPSSVFESLLPKLLSILQVTQRPEGTSNVRNKQDLLQAIQAFREALNNARSTASALPGGEMLIEEQEEIIAMLERLREKKRYVVQVLPMKIFSFGWLEKKRTSSRADRMEVDSNASTPA
ncbi:hypothetical protein BJV77DRAFT_943694 [Russula vinacea]|nr:hypothetical protein BJV77DRAFT_943694 [Russula vinacea]